MIPDRSSDHHDKCKYNDKHDNNKSQNQDCEIEYIVRILLIMYIIMNAQRLGWTVELELGELRDNKNKIILTKKSNTLTRLDRNTPLLINELVKMRSTHDIDIDIGISTGHCVDTFE